MDKNGFIVTSDLHKQITDDYRLTTAEIFYHMPDCPHLLQTYLWQDYDLAPQFPILGKFLDFWTRELDGPLHSVMVDSCEIITPSQSAYYDVEFSLQ